MKIYTDLDKILHRQFLGDSALSDFFYNRILSNSKVRYLEYPSQHIFVTGLARAGTTALLNRIYSSKEVSSLVYKYMPFILSPKIANFYADNFYKDENLLSERYHKDGIFINSNSPECLDEVFWIKSDNNYYNSRILTKDTLDKNILQAYSYLLKAYSNPELGYRMLIKNNNHHCRITPLSNYFTNSVFLILFREPLTHSNSLLQQHKNFCALQKTDPFILEYMNLLGHREFGLGSHPFIYSSAAPDCFKSYEKFELNYWLFQWIKTYEWILSNDSINRSNVYLISYEKLCEKKGLYESLCKKINISNYKNGNDFKLSNNQKSEYQLSIDDELIDKAKSIYDSLTLKSY